MNRLQKKCVIATAGFHLLLLVIIFVGPGFFWSREQPPQPPELDMIPANLIDAVSTGVQSPQPPTQIVTPPPPAPPVVPQVVTPPKPVSVPEKVEPVKLIKPEPNPIVKPEVPKPQTPKINMDSVTRLVPKNPLPPVKPPPDNSKAINDALMALRKDLSHDTAIAPVDNSTVAAANYAQVVKSVYEQAWILPDDMASDAANTKVRVTIGSDGRVIDAKIITPSGDEKLDDSVRRTLERVQVIAPFPTGTTDTERTYIINFNPQIKRMLG